MTEVLVLSDDEVRGLHDPGALAEALREALRSLSAGSTSVPPRVGASSDAGMLGVMPGFVPGMGLGAKLVTVFRDNERRGVPSHQAMVALVDPDTGAPLVIMGATFITAIRTATTAAVAARALARPGAPTVAIIGAGVQGASHLDAFSHAFEPAEIRVAARNSGRASELAERSAVGTAVGSFEKAVRGADVVCLCTDADDPVITRAWLRRGAHVSSVGSGREVDPETLADASVYVESRASVTQPYPAGARELSGWDPSSLTEVGEVLLGTRPGRESDDEVTVYKSTGHAVEDLAAASVVYRAAVDRGVGTTVTL